MAKEEIKRINISDTPDLLRLAEEVRKDNRVIVLVSNGEEVARLTPPARKRRRRGWIPSSADMEAFRAAAGSWRGVVDTDKLKEDIYESRRLSTRPAPKV